MFPIPSFDEVNKCQSEAMGIATYQEFVILFVAVKEVLM